MKQLSKVLFTIASSLVLASCTMAQSVSENIALHKPVTFNTKPNYSYSTDPEDDIQLTDGKYSSEGQLEEVEKTRSIWVQKGTVGWVNRSPVVITIDLGKEQPISGTSFSTAAGISGVYWPKSIQMFTSNDDKNWHYQGDLIQISRKNGAPPANGYATFRYATHDLNTKGRYIAFGVDYTSLLFCDEIEVYRGNEVALSQPYTGKTVTSIADFVRTMAITTSVQARIQEDAYFIKKEIADSAIPAERKSTFDTALNIDIDSTYTLPALPKGYKAILPINDIHTNVLAVRGEFLAAQGFKPLTVWDQPCYAWLPLLAQPQKGQKAALNFSQLRNQFRSDSILLTNASGKSERVLLRLKNAPQNVQDGWLQVYSVAWTDTAQSVPIADALFPVEVQNGAYMVTIPAGITRKVWFTVDSSKVPAGSYKSTFEVQGMGQNVSVPLSLNVAKLAMSKPRLSLGMWDYTDHGGHYAINRENMEATIELMRSHYIDSPWAAPKTLPIPPAAAFDEQGNLIKKLDFTVFDQWVSMWPDAKHYFTFPNVGKSFAGKLMGTPEFNVRVGNWAKALAAHMEELGINPEKLGIYLIDEPHNDEMNAIVTNWSKAINATAPEITLFETPAWPRPDALKGETFFSQVDILCPTPRTYYTGGKHVQKFYQDLRAEGKKLWLYQASGPVRLFSPQTYYRYQAWSAFSIGATGEGFWAFADTSSAPSSFSEYGTSRVNYAPVFFDGGNVYDSIHWDAVRDGVEDYEMLAMLRDAINVSQDAVWKARAQKVLDDVVSPIADSWVANWRGVNFYWDKAKPADTDAKLDKVLQALISTPN